MASDELERTCNRCGKKWYVPKALLKDLGAASSPGLMVMHVLLGNTLTQTGASITSQNARMEINRLNRCPSCGSSTFSESEPSNSYSLPSTISQTTSRTIESPQTNTKQLSGKIEFVELMTKSEISFQIVPREKGLHVSSIPSGIDLYLGERGVPVGKTPLTLRLPLGNHILDGSRIGTFLFRGRIHVEYIDVPPETNHPKSSTGESADKDTLSLGGSDLISALERLASLFEKGLLSSEEFSTAKQALLKERA